MKNRKWLWRSALLLAVVLAGAIIGLRQWRDHVSSRQRVAIDSEVRDLSEEGLFREATLAFRRAYPQPASGDKDGKHVERELQLAVEARDIGRIEALAGAHPDIFLANEEASLMWARLLVHFRRQPEFRETRAAWAGREQDTAAWFFLDLQILCIDGRRKEARAFLETRSFEGVSEARRLVYQALLGELSPQDTLKLLAKAHQLDPKDDEIRTFAGNIFESDRKIVLAQREYVAAYLADPVNPLTRDNLAEFYRRRGNLTQALASWVPRNSEKPVPDFIWFKYYFWSRVFNGKSIDASTIETSSWSNLAGILASAENARFWSPEALGASRPVTSGTRTVRKYLYWLEVLETLASGDESKALELIYSASPKELSVAPVMAAALKRTINYRETNRLVSAKPPKPNLHPFLQDLFMSDKADLPRESDTLLQGDLALTAVALAGGWMNAALRFHADKEENSIQNCPEWFQYALAQAYRYCRGASPAITFIERLDPMPVTLMALRGELYIGNGDIQKGMALLEEICQDESDAGFRAALLLAVAHFEMKEFGRARKTVESLERLNQSIVGRELLAKIAWGSGSTVECETIYRDILETSVEAKIYFARQAFQSKDWVKARSLTEEAISLAPNQADLHENLIQIQQASAKLR